MRSGRPRIRPWWGVLWSMALGVGAQAAGESGVRAWVSNPGMPGFYLRSQPTERVAIPETGDTWLLADAGVRFQEIEGFGAALTDSTLIVLDSLPPVKRTRLLRELFDPRRGLNLSYVRIPIGASDFGVTTYTYADSEDPTLKNFDMRRALPAIALVKKLKVINPSLRILLSPWSPPAWMKSSGSLNGGSLKPEHYPTYARYLLKVLQGYARRGLEVDTLTIQNEPFFANDKYPSMEMPSARQIEFLRDHLLPLLRQSGLRTKVLALDHNYDYRAEAESVISALEGKLAGIAYHCYGGEIEDLRGSAAPLYQTECSGGEWSSAPETFHFWLQSQVIAAGNFGNRFSLGWNLALDQNHGPFLGYCENCRGLVDIDTVTKKVTFNPELIALAHAAKFLGPGAMRISAPAPLDGNYSTIAYLNADGTVVHVAENAGPASRNFVVPTPAGDFFRVTVPAGGAATVLVPPMLQ